MTDLRTAAQALVDRWDTPLWKDTPHTGKYIDALRAALAEPDLHAAIMSLRHGWVIRGGLRDTYVRGWQDARHAAAELAHAALSAPAGWKLVPIEPTPETIEAMRNGPGDYHFRDINDQINAAYCRAIAAAPSPQEQT